MKGAFQTSREIFENPIWTDVIKFRIFFYIYGNAVFAKEGTSIAGIHLKRGQYLRSYRNLQKDLGYVEKRHQKVYSLNTIKSKIENLVNEKRIRIESTDYGTLFTVLNYEEYQGFGRYTKYPTDTATDTPTDTASEQQVNNNKNVNKDNNKHDDFEALWKLYPRKEGDKKRAEKSYQRAIKSGVTNKQIQDGIVRYVKRINLEGIERRFIAQGATWFNQNRWTDEYEVQEQSMTSDGQRQGLTPQEIKDKEQRHLEKITREAEERLKDE